ncbi:hypothetical protein KDX32_21515 [Burkholderia ambifaria]|uniref:hypothetical protein n=1 Tax=Burkholderia ambifaria TaxID=152480 RepID=UPI001BA036B5|nr:hypothetical protein [Burkholderia ambifaria]MBR8065650.1 hypothetical protein [Burkholderia ambifaria]
MIESGRKAVYEAIVRRKSRAAIWRAIAVGPAPGARLADWPTGRLAEISACSPDEFRNLGWQGAATLSADETNPL